MTLFYKKCTYRIDLGAVSPAVSGEKLPSPEAVIALIWWLCLRRCLERSCLHLRQWSRWFGGGVSGGVWREAAFTWDSDRVDLVAVSPAVSGEKLPSCEAVIALIWWLSLRRCLERSCLHVRQWSHWFGGGVLERSLRLTETTGYSACCYGILDWKMIPDPESTRKELHTLMGNPCGFMISFRVVLSWSIPRFRACRLSDALIYLHVHVRNCMKSLLGSDFLLFTVDFHACCTSFARAAFQSHPGLHVAGFFCEGKSGRFLI
jgi:hypothetical protein